MTAINVVRFRVKPGLEDEFVKLYQDSQPSLAGMRKFSLIRTGDRSYCLVGEWDNMDCIVNARPALIERLDGMRRFLEDLGGDLGLTDPVSGEVVVEHLNR